MQAFDGATGALLGSPVGSFFAYDPGFSGGVFVAAGGSGRRWTSPDGITFTVEGPTKLGVQGIDKQLVGETAAKIRKLRKPEPYKGKGVRYAGEHIRRKVGKAGK